MHDLLTTPSNISHFYELPQRHLLTHTLCITHIPWVTQSGVSVHKTTNPRDDLEPEPIFHACSSTFMSGMACGAHRITCRALHRFHSHMHVLHAIARLLSIWIERTIWSCSRWRGLFGQHAPSPLFGLAVILCLAFFWCVSLSLSLRRSSSPRCSSVSGFHQSKRLRHSQLVSTTAGFLPRSCVWMSWKPDDWECSPVFPLLFEMMTSLKDSGSVLFYN